VQMWDRLQEPLAAAPLQVAPLSNPSSIARSVVSTHWLQRVSSGPVHESYAHCFAVFWSGQHPNPEIEHITESTAQGLGGWVDSTAGTATELLELSLELGLPELGLPELGLPELDSFGLARILTASTGKSPSVGSRTPTLNMS